MNDQYLTETSESVPADSNGMVMGERPNVPNAHTNRSVFNGHPVNVDAVKPKATHITQAKKIKPPKINGKYTSAALETESQSILLQLIMFKDMKNMLELTGNLCRKLG